MSWYNPATWSPVDTIQAAINSGPVANGPDQAYSNYAAPTGGHGTEVYNGAGQASGPIQLSGYDPGQAGGSGPATSDPYSQWGGTAAYNNLVNGFNTQKGNIFSSANSAADNLAPGYAQSVTDTLHNLTVGQQAIDRKAVQNESSKIAGTRGVLGMVGRGIQSGGVALANRNAGNSSAAGAIAQAYGQLGQRQLSSIGNQYAQNADDIAVDQGNQDWNVQQAPNKFHLGLMDNVNSIVNDARNQLASLDSQIAQANLPQRIAIEQEKENIKNQVLGKLQQYDSQLQTGAGGIKASSFDERRTKANEQLSAGQADPNLFSYSTEAPAQFQGTGPTASNLPLFTLNRRRATA